jgi:Sec-independent protein translocase protein TatA
MIAEAAFLLFFGLLVFGPKKTIEMAQRMGSSLAPFKRTAGQFQSEIEGELRRQHNR